MGKTKMTSKVAKVTREAWLEQLVRLLAPVFKAHQATIPAKLRCTCGFPKGDVSKVTGQCWHPESSADGSVEILINPTHDDGIEVAGTLVHELVHAAIGPGKKHGKEFKELATALGLEGKMWATHPGKELTERLEEILKGLGRYPHAKLILSQVTKVGPGPKRYVRLECPDCGYIAYVTNKWYELGTLTCCCDATMAAT